LEILVLSALFHDLFRKPSYLVFLRIDLRLLALHFQRHDLRDIRHGVRRQAGEV
jgi:hypothetical protein